MLPPRSFTACNSLPPRGAAFFLGSGPSEKPLPPGVVGFPFGRPDGKSFVSRFSHGVVRGLPWGYLRLNTSAQPRVSSFFLHD